jgi:hypothetical protein
MNKMKTLYAAGIIGLTAILGACGKGPEAQNYYWHGQVPAAQEYAIGTTVYSIKGEKSGSDTQVYTPSDSNGMMILKDINGDFAPEQIELHSVPKNDKRRELTISKLAEIVEQAVSAAKANYKSRL